MSAPLMAYILKAALRDRLLLSLAVLLTLACALSYFLASAAIIEQDRFAAVFTAGSVRILNVFGLVLFTVFFIRRSFDARDVEFMLARPVGRLRFILSYSLGLSVLAIVLAVLSGALMLAISPQHFSSGLMLWTLSQVFENMIMINAALFFSMVLTSAATASFAVLGFYVLARMMSQILGIIDAHTHLMHTEILQTVMQGISMLMPRLDLMGQTSWLVYGPGPDIGALFIIVQGLIYTAVLVFASWIDLTRRQF